MAMTAKESKMAALLLRAASDEFSYHGCNDLDAAFIRKAGLTDEEKITFVKEFEVWNGEPGMYGEIKPHDFDRMHDCSLMAFLAHKLEQEK